LKLIPVVSPGKEVISVIATNFRAVWHSAAHSCTAAVCNSLMAIFAQYRRDSSTPEDLVTNVRRLIIEMEIARLCTEQEREAIRDLFTKTFSQLARLGNGKGVSSYQLGLIKDMILSGSPVFER